MMLKLRGSHVSGVFSKVLKLSSEVSECKPLFRGLIASLDGKTILETSRTGAWGAADGVAAGKDAGDYLKTLAPKEFFESLVENGVSW
jgi:hypothetical protein